MPEEKELTIEEMKSLVSLASLLPALLEKISQINKDLFELKTSFTEIKTKFNNNTNAVLEYKGSVDELIKKQPDLKPVIEKIDQIQQDLLDLSNKFETSKNIKKISEEKKNNNKDKPSEVLKPKKPEEDPDKEKVEEVIDKILGTSRGRKTRVLTAIDIKTGFKVDDVIAAKVIKWFTDKKMYNPKMRMLTFPKK